MSACGLARPSCARGAERLGREISGGVSGSVADSGHAAVYLRQLLRGNRAKRALDRCAAARAAGDATAATPGSRRCCSSTATSRRAARCTCSSGT